MKVMVTRPAREAARTAERLALLGHVPLVEPLLTVRPTEGLVVPPDAAAILATSANAFLALPPSGGPPVFCVGDRTADAARVAGFDRVASADGDVDALVALVAGRLAPSDGPLVYLAGRDRSGDLGGRLGGLGFRVVVVEAYRADPATALSHDGHAALRDGIGAVLLYSARTAETFARLVAAARLDGALRPTLLACLSGAVAERVAGLPSRAVVVAAHPTEDALLDALTADARAPRS